MNILYGDYQKRKETEREIVKRNQPFNTHMQNCIKSLFEGGARVVSPLSSFHMFATIINYEQE